MKPLALVSALVVAGCVTVDPVVDSDFVERVIPVDYDTALKNIRKGWQVCTAPQLGSPSYLQFDDHVLIDVHGVSPYLKDTSRRRYWSSGTMGTPERDKGSFSDTCQSRKPPAPPELDTVGTW